MITHTNLLKPLPKPELGEKVEFMHDDVILNTNIDGFSYMLNNPHFKDEVLLPKDKFSFEGSSEIYTVKNIDYSKAILEAKMDKVVQLDELEHFALRSKHLSWNEPDVADKLKPNYFMFIDNSDTISFEFVIDGKLSKNQVVRFMDYLIKITELKKLKDGMIEIIGERIEFKTLQDIHPYKVDNVVQEWYTNIKDAWLKQAQEVKSEN